MQKDGYDILKRFAQMAKNRLRNKVKENDNKLLRQNDKYRILFGECVEISNRIITKEDTKFYNKVKTMLDENQDITNPIAKLIDYKVFNKLDDMAKERYLFNLVDKYKTYKNKYYEEKIKEVI